MIKPTVGRVVWFYERGKTQVDAGEQPFSASIAYVHSGRMLNIGYLDHNGVAKSQTSIPLIQEGDPIPEFGGYCMWMPYQVGQAKKTEALEAELTKT